MNVKNETHRRSKLYNGNINRQLMHFMYDQSVAREDIDEKWLSQMGKDHEFYGNGTTIIDLRKIVHFNNKRYPLLQRCTINNVKKVLYKLKDCVHLKQLKSTDKYHDTTVLYFRFKITCYDSYLNIFKNEIKINADLKRLRGKI